MTGSWRTTVSSAVTAFFGFVLFSPQNFAAYPWLVDLAKYAFLGGLVGMGIFSKDFNVTGVPMQVQPPTVTVQTPVEEPKP